MARQVQTLHWRWNNKVVRVCNMNLFCDNFENRFLLLEEQGDGDTTIIHHIYHD